MKAVHLHIIVAFIFGLLLSFIPYSIYVGEEHYDSISAEVWRKGVGFPFGRSVGLRSEGYPYERHETLWLTVTTYPVAYVGDRTDLLSIAVLLLNITLNTIVCLLVILLFSFLASMRKI